MNRPHHRNPPLSAAAAAITLPVLRRIAIQRSLDEAEYVLARAACELVSSARIYVHYVRPQTRTLWTMDVPDLDVPVGGVSVIAFAAHVGEVLALDPIAAHPLYAPDIDDPVGTGHEPALVAPITCDHRVLAVISAVREPWWPAFSTGDRAHLANLCAKAAPLLDRFLRARI